MPKIRDTNAALIEDLKNENIRLKHERDLVRPYDPKWKILNECVKPFSFSMGFFHAAKEQKTDPRYYHLIDQINQNKRHIKQLKREQREESKVSGIKRIFCS